MQSKSKRMIALVLAFVLLIGSSFAYFSDFAQDSATGTAGTVALSLDSNINLLDANGMDIINPGDQRDAGFTVTNEGNKSVDVRTTIVLTTQSNTGKNLAFSGDAAVQSEYDLYLRSDVDFVEGEGYKPNADAQPLQVKSVDGNKITYVLPQYILNGNSDEYDEVETVDGVDGHAKIHDFVFVMKGDSGNEWQNSAVQIDILVEAKQHENTAAGWNIVAQETVISGEINQDAVLGEDVITEIESASGSDDDSSNPPSTVQYSNTLMNGYNFSQNAIMYETTSVTFTNTAVPNGVETIDVSDVGDGGVLAWFEGTDMYVTTVNGGTLYANPNSSNLFYNRSRIVEINFDNFDTSKVTDMNNMFYSGPWSSSKITTLDLSGWDTSNVTDMSFVFKGMKNLVEVKGLEDWNTTNVTTMQDMFNGCSSLEELELTNFNVAKVQNTGGMFKDCTSLEIIDLSTWNLSSILFGHVSEMFMNCENLTTIYANEWANPNISQSPISYDMFTGCVRLVGAVAYDETQVAWSMATPTTGYFTTK